MHLPELALAVGRDRRAGRGLGVRVDVEGIVLEDQLHLVGAFTDRLREHGARCATGGTLEVRPLDDDHRRRCGALAGRVGEVDRLDLLLAEAPPVGRLRLTPRAPLAHLIGEETRRRSASGAGTALLHALGDANGLIGAGGEQLTHLRRPLALLPGRELGRVDARQLHVDGRALGSRIRLRLPGGAARGHVQIDQDRATQGSHQAPAQHCRGSLVPPPARSNP